MQDDRGLLGRYAAGERNFSGTDWRGIKLYRRDKEIDLSGADFSSANLEDAILSHVKLHNANFSGANLRNARINGKINYADFSEADLTNAHLGVSRLKGTKFRGANLTNADFGGNSSKNTNLDFSNADCTNTKLTCDLLEANFQDANVKYAIFRLKNSYWYQANLNRANLSLLDLRGQDFSTLEMSGVNLIGSNLAGANLTSANLEGADLRGANLEGADLSYVNLRRTRIEGAIALDPKILLIWQIINQGAKSQRLQSADLSSANLKDVNFSEVDLREVNFKRADLTGANLSHADLSGANLQNASLSRANLENATLNQAQLVGTSLSAANLNQANLDQAYLLSANLTRATLQNATLRNANLTNANLEGADLTGADLSDADLTGTELFRANLLNTINASGSASIFSNTPNNPNLELLNQIREACEGLYYMSESDYPYEVFLWETGTQGDFSLEGLLKAFGHLRELSADAFCTHHLDTLEWLQPLANNTRVLEEEQKVIEAFRRLLNQLAAYLTNLQTLRLSVPQQDFYIVLGNTPSGDWLGISTQVSSSLEQQHSSSQIFRVRDLAVAKPENQELIATLENAIAGVRFSCEYLQGFVWEIVEQRSALIHNLLDTLRITTTNEVQAVFRTYHNKNQESQANRLVMENLSNLRLYRLSAVEIDMYFVGQTEDGDWLGFRTKAVET